MEQMEILRHAPRVVFDLRDQFAEEQTGDGPPRGPIGRVRLLVTDRRGSQENPDAEVWSPLRSELELELLRTNQDFFVWFGLVRKAAKTLDERSRFARREGPFEPGRLYRVKIESEYYAPQPALERELGSDLPGPMVGVPDGDTNSVRGPVTVVELRPGHAYPFVGSSVLPVDASAVAGTGPTLLRGSVVDASGAGMSGVVVEYRIGDNIGDDNNENPTYLTDCSGQWVLPIPRGAFSHDGLGGDRVEIRHALRVTFRSEPPRSIDIPEVRAVRGRETRYRQTALQGRVMSVRGGPLPGVRITLSEGDERAVTGADGAWAIYFPVDRHADLNEQPRITVTAVSPSGDSGSTDVTISPRRMVSVPPFRLA